MADPIETEMDLIYQYAYSSRPDGFRQYEYAEMILRYRELLLKQCAKRKMRLSSHSEMVAHIASRVGCESAFVARVIKKGPDGFKPRRLKYEDTTEAEFEALVYLFEQSSPEALSQFQDYLRCKGWWSSPLRPV